MSQSTISRAITAITAITPELARVLRPFTPAAEELFGDEQLIVDGSLVSCWSWDDHPELYSGKHHTTGLNLQVVCDLAGRLRWISDPSRAAAMTAPHCAVPTSWTGSIPRTGSGDKGYIGLAMITPIRKPPHRELLDWERSSTLPSTKSAGESNKRSRT